MRSALLKLVVLILVLLGALGARSGETIDGVIATVNGVPLLQSDLEDSIRFEAFLQQRSLREITSADRQQALDRLVDRELLRQQMPADFDLTSSEIGNYAAQVRSQFKGAETPEGWKRILAGYGFTEGTVNERLADQFRTLRFIDLRLRPTIRVDREAVTEYYNETLVPSLRKMNVKIDPLPAVSDKIEELLTQQKMDSLLSAWIANLRSQSQIHIEDQQTSQAARAAAISGGDSQTAR